VKYDDKYYYVSTPVIHIVRLGDATHGFVDIDDNFIDYQKEGYGGNNCPGGWNTKICMLRNDDYHISGIVLHHTAGGRSSIQYRKSMENKNDNVGAQYFVDRDGNITISYPDFYKAYHAGVNGDKDNNPNDYTVGIEITNWGTAEYLDGYYNSYKRSDGSRTIMPDFANYKIKGVKNITDQNLKLPIDNNIGIQFKIADKVDEKFELKLFDANEKEKQTCSGDISTYGLSNMKLELDIQGQYNMKFSGCEDLKLQPNATITIKWNRDDFKNKGLIENINRISKTYPKCTQIWQHNSNYSYAGIGDEGNRALDTWQNYTQKQLESVDMLNEYLEERYGIPDNNFFQYEHLKKANYKNLTDQEIKECAFYYHPSDTTEEKDHFYPVLYSDSDTHWKGIFTHHIMTGKVDVPPALDIRRLKEMRNNR
jgi:N-acetyl-anhydromuramyl-L-alanine amidase AmpD